MDPEVAARRALDEGRRAALVTVVSVKGNPPSRPGLKLAVVDDSVTFGTLGCDGFDKAGAEDARRSLYEGKKIEARYRWEDASFIEVEVVPLQPSSTSPDAVEIPELLIVGKGPVARGLIAIGEALGFHVRVAAGPEPPSVGELDGADEVIVTRDFREVAALRPGPNTFVVICGHDEHFSIPALRALVDSEAPYLGMMGSRRHTGHLLEELRTEGVSEADLARIHTPVGLDLGAETPEEIALSALAQVVVVRRSGGGRPLDEGA